MHVSLLDDMFYLKICFGNNKLFLLVFVLVFTTIGSISEFHYSR